jgi:hypothetical protein
MPFAQTLAFRVHRPGQAPRHRFETGIGDAGEDPSEHPFFKANLLIP